MPIDVLFVGDTNIQFVPTFVDQDSTVIDISAATAKYVRLRKPDGTVSAKTATFYTDGEDGKLSYYSEAGLFLSADIGLWQWQGYAETPTGKFKTQEKSFLLSEI